MTNPGSGDEPAGTDAGSSRSQVPQAFDYDVAIIGAGPAGLFVAERLAGAGLSVAIYEQMPSPARKLLMAGRGGLNLTHSEPLGRFLKRYHPAEPRLLDAISAFPPESLVAWAEGLGIATFKGSSGRIFPRAMKASPLVRAWLQRLGSLGARLHLRHRMIEIAATWDQTVNAGSPGITMRFEHVGNPGSAIQAGQPGSSLQNGVITTVRARAVVLALGGASWPKLGSDGTWAPQLTNKGVSITPIAPANAGLRVSWSDHFVQRHAGQPLKRIVLTIAGHHFPGELVITRNGLEGGPAYAANRLVREALAATHGASPVVAALDLRPDLDTQTLAARLSTPRGKQSFANHLRKRGGLTALTASLLREGSHVETAGKDATVADRSPVNPSALPAMVLAERIKSLLIEVHGLCGLDRAISTAGGIARDALDDNFMLKDLPGVFAAGEMLDWEAPTGGYLLQATFATASAAADGVRRTLDAA